MAKGIREIYATYRETSEFPVEYAVFKEIIVEFNCGIMDFILDGGVFNMGNKLSELFICRRKRDPRVNSVNWNLSLKEKKKILEEGKELFDAETGKGEQWLIYYTDPWYFRWRWYKDKCVVKNKSVYRFDPTRGVKGNKGKLMELTKNDDLAYLKFKQYDEKVLN